MRIFLSHNHQDLDFCNALVQSLREGGAGVWYEEALRLDPTNTEAAWGKALVLQARKPWWEKIW
jgi:hypothetical protein